MIDLLPIGSVVEWNESKLIIMGYREFQTETLNYFYIVGAFPIGFTGCHNSLTLLPINLDLKLISKGYVDASVERWLLNKKKVMTCLLGQSTASMEDILDSIFGRNEETTDE